MVEETIENMCGIACIRRNHLGIEGCVLIGDVGVKEHAWFIAITQIGPETLTVGRGSGSFAPVPREGVLMMMVDQLGESLRVGFVPCAQRRAPVEFTGCRAKTGFRHFGDAEVNAIGENNRKQQDFVLWPSIRRSISSPR
jgi:hypothetical protein